MQAEDGVERRGKSTGLMVINGCEVHDREKAVALLSSEDTRSVILLVTRPELQLEEDVWLDDDQQELVQLKMEILEQRRKHKEQKFDRRKELQLEEGMTTDTATCSSNNQDSGFGHGTDSPDHQPLLSRIHKKSPAQCLRERWLADHPHNKPPKTQSKTQDNGNSPMLGLENRFQQLLELKCQIRNGVECGVYSIRHSIECSLTEQSGGDEEGVNSGESEGGVEHELRMLNEELRSIELECQSIMQSHQLRQSSQPTQTPVRSPKDGLKLRGRLADIHEHPERSDTERRKDSSSAYNTAESARSTPAGVEKSPDHSLQRQSYMQLLHQHSSLEYSQSQLSLLSLCREPGHRGGRPGEPRLEWKVKVRADGTRYVARRPARDRILRERALRIREERSGGMTTDDDAMSEMKMGRYWSKEERKQHLARAREQRKRREFMQKSRLECLREGSGGNAEARNQVNILELSHKKMLKKRNKKILDNWMTIQELMSHGARVQEDSKVHNAFLSVTTV
uniref:Uncharacterized protein n=1 Tax=Knipowitschia caucasica TaxID=637954 RepID=A0AAV2J121_KNICA